MKNYFRVNLKEYHSIKFPFSIRFLFNIKFPFSIRFLSR
jgi:hypothetical protein